MFVKGQSGNPGGRPKGMMISSLIIQLLAEKLPDGKTKGQMLAQKIVDLALSDDTKTKDFVDLAGEIIDRIEGKAVNTNINAELPANPFDGIPTEKIEALKKRLEEMGK